MGPIVIDFTGAKVEHQAGPVDWLAFILECNDLCNVGGAPKLFDDPEIESNGPTGVYTEQYRDALVELDGDGTSTARIYSVTEHASSVMRVAAERLGRKVIELDTESPGSRQHYIDTGRYLRPGEAAAYSLSPIPEEVTGDDVAERVLNLWRECGGWIPGAAKHKLATALGVPVEKLDRR